MNNYSRLFVLVTSCSFLGIDAEFNKHFADFIEKNYGKKLLNTLQRSDLGDSGSFGGKSKESEQLENDPVIFIHGVSDIAGGKMQALAATYKKRGYSSGELYATTYDDGPGNNPLAWTEYSLKCEHVKQIRTLILAVRYYTLRDVDIVAYSLGVPITRKAILGGTCVDTQEDLGSSLTQYVDTFIGVAGPNHGISLQVAGISIPGCVIGAIPILPICSRVIGLYSGLCPTESAFLTDINKSNHYEGKYVFTLFTETDSWIGYQICDKVTAQIPGEDGHKLYSKLTHDDIILKTCDMQIKLLKNHAFNDEEEEDPTDISSEISHAKLNRKSKPSRSNRKREVEDYDLPPIPPQLYRSSKMSTSTEKTIDDFTTNAATKSHKSYRGTDIDTRSNQTTSSSSSSETVLQNGYHTRVNVSFD